MASESRIPKGYLNFFIIISAPDLEAAKNQVEGHAISCSWAKPPHSFTAANVSVEPLGKYPSLLKVKNFPFGENIPGVGKQGVLSAEAIRGRSEAEKEADLRAA